MGDGRIGSSPAGHFTLWAQRGREAPHFRNVTTAD